jgi:hypothetical protein
MEPISMLAAGAATLFATRMVEEAGSQTGKGLSAAAGRLIAWCICCTKSLPGRKSRPGLRPGSPRTPAARRSTPPTPGRCWYS